MAASGVVKMAKTSAKLLPLDKNAKRRFLRLVDKSNSLNNGDRVIGRIEMRGFLDKHGEAQCRAFYTAYEAKLKQRIER